MTESLCPGLKRNRQIKDYICHRFCEESKETLFALDMAEKADLKPIQVPLNVAKILSMIAKLTRPKRVLEIGTLAGYSTLWLYRGLAEEGKIWTIEMDPQRIAIAKEVFAFANAHQIEILEGSACEILMEMGKDQTEAFDLIFIDADKSEYPDYLDLLLPLCKSGTVILSDNGIPKRGSIGIPDPRDNEAIGIYLFNERLSTHPMLDTTVLTTIVGENGRVDSLQLTLVC